MPKFRKGKIPDIKPQTSSSPPAPIASDKSGNLKIKIAAKPGAKENSITGITEEGVGVRINARPVEGEANSELVKFISSLLGVKKSSVSLDKGNKSRQKTILVTDPDMTPDEALSKLNKNISKD